MISFAQSLPVGNAARVVLAPAAGAVKTRVLRKATDTIASAEDPEALVVHDGDGSFFIDTSTLTNGATFYYQAFDSIDDAWVASPSVSVPILASAGMEGPDVLDLVRDRIEQALKVEVGAGRLRHERGYIPCLTAPPAFDNVTWPIVSVHMRSDSDQVRALGELVGSDVFDPEDEEWGGGEGWLSAVTIDICGWSLNADERKALRKAIKKAVLGNLPVFDAAGMAQISLSQSDLEDFESYGAPVYQAMNSLQCLAPAVVSASTSSVTDVIAIADCEVAP